MAKLPLFFHAKKSSPQRPRAATGKRYIVLLSLLVAVLGLQPVFATEPLDQLSDALFELLAKKPSLNARSSGARQGLEIVPGNDRYSINEPQPKPVEVVNPPASVPIEKMPALPKEPNVKKITSPTFPVQKLQKMEETPKVAIPAKKSIPPKVVKKSQPVKVDNEATSTERNVRQKGEKISAKTNETPILHQLALSNAPMTIDGATLAVATELYYQHLSAHPLLEEMKEKASQTEQPKIINATVLPTTLSDQDPAKSIKAPKEVSHNYLFFNISKDKFDLILKILLIGAIIILFIWVRFKKRHRVSGRYRHR